MLLAAKVGDELFKRLGQPTLVGEILAGVIVGPSVLGLVEPSEVLEVFAELGVVGILFWVGLETRIGQLVAVGRPAALVGVFGVVLPLAGGVLFGFGIGEDGSSAVFFGAALVATSVGITAAILAGLGLVGSRPGRTILGAAVIDDILAMLIVAVASAVAATAGEVDVLELVVVGAMASGFVAFFALGGTRFMRRYPNLLTAPRFSESPLLPAVLLCLGLAALSAKVGLATVIGAFLAGLIVAETPDCTVVEEEIAPLYAFFAPFFFAVIGIQLDLGELLSPEALALLAALTVVAVGTKLAGAWLGARGLGARAALLVGVGMVPRGEVGIVVAEIGLAAAVFDDQAYALIVAMSVATTLLVPPVLRAVARGLPHESYA